tara:strand:- start:15313 stop:16107 length:795 start_codon:yes stop_codon:yes gene_type:complete
MKNVSLAVPTYFSSKYLNVLLKSIKNSKYIDEVIISDDSADKNEIKKIEKIVTNFQKSNKNINIKIYQNKENFNAFNNKYLAVSKCTNEIVYQIDSDNIASKDIDTTLRDILNSFDEENIYLPAYLRQFFYNYQYYLNQNKNIVNLSSEDKVLDSVIISDSVIFDKKITIDKNIYWILNCGNFIVSKKKYLGVMEEFYNNQDIPLAADALAISYLWLKSNLKIVLKKDFFHYHRKRKDSVSLSLTNEMEESFKYFKEKFKTLSH